MHLIFVLNRLLRRSLFVLLAGFWGLIGFFWLPVRPALAESLITRETPGYQQLSQEISSLQAKGSSLSTLQGKRLSELQVLESAIADSNDRATISNNSQHNLGFFARYKKELSDQSASFYVLAPGHDSDDDYEVVAFYLPPQVSLDWQGSSTSATASPRLVRVLSGESLTITDLPDQVESTQVTYQLSLPAFSVDTRNSDVAQVPDLGQDQLDALPETAPVD